MPDYSLGRVWHPETPEAAGLYPVTAHPKYRAVSDTHRFWWQDGAWLNQGQTGTCVGNAFAHRRADSPVPVTGIDEAYAQKLYVDASGDPTLQQGTSGLAACRVLKSRGEISAYHWISSMDEFINTLLTIGPVCTGTNWYNSQFQPEPLYNNFYLVVDPSSGIAGGHETVYNAINLKPTRGKPYARLKNSWGTDWGHHGTVRVYLDDVEQLIFGDQGDAVVITEN